MLVLAIETTCDETAAAVFNERREILSSVVASQAQLHERFGGVVPEIAARAHAERILPTIDEAVRLAGCRLEDLDAIAVAYRPGLAGSLLVGLSAAKALCLALDVPLVAVDHLYAHIYACRLAHGPQVYPCVGLIVSGGHTSLYRCEGPLELELLGGTIDDAAGEAFDKVSHLLGLGYPGGPAIERAAKTGNPRRHRFPRAFLDEPDRLEFSFSGLKTAVRYRLHPPDRADDELAPPTPQELADIAASFQEAVVEILTAKSIAAARLTGLATICVGGGVAANGRLRQRLGEAAAASGLALYFAPPHLCTDNAAMAALALEQIEAKQFAELDLEVRPGRRSS